jgi:CDP-paratose 2-epimerase
MSRHRSLQQNGFVRSTPSVLVLGGAGFIGTNLSARLLEDGRRVTVFDDLSRPGAERNLAWLRSRYGRLLDVRLEDVRDADAVADAVEHATSVFDFAAQVAVTTSLVDPREDFEVNLAGTINVLEALRARDEAVPLLYTSTNKVYGCLEDVPLHEGASRWEPRDDRLRSRGIDETRPIELSTPYGCSKGAADQYVIDYARSFGLRTVVFRMSCIYGIHQNGTEDQGWVAHLVKCFRDRTDIRIYGDGKQVRDLLFVDDLVDAMLLARERIDELSGSAFNIGGGVLNTASLLEVLAHAERLSGARPRIDLLPWRTGDQQWYVSDYGRFHAATGWHPRVGVAEGIARLHAWLSSAESRSRGGWLGAAPLRTRSAT